MGTRFSWVALAVVLGCGSNAPEATRASVVGAGGDVPSDAGTIASGGANGSGGGATTGGAPTGSGGETLGGGGAQASGGMDSGGAQGAGGSVAPASGGAASAGGLSLDGGTDGGSLDAGPRPVFTQFATCPKLDNACPPPNTWTNGFTCDYIGMSESGTDGWTPCWKQPCNAPGELPPCGTVASWGVSITWDATTGYSCFTDVAKFPGASLSLHKQACR